MRVSAVPGPSFTYSNIHNINVHFLRPELAKKFRLRFVSCRGSFHDHVIEVGSPHEIRKLLHQFLLLFALCPTCPLPTTPGSLSALDPLLLAKVFMGDQLQILAPRSSPTESSGGLPITSPPYSSLPFPTLVRLWEDPESRCLSVPRLIS